MSKHQVKPSRKNKPLGALYACAFSLPAALITGAVLLILSAAIAYAQADPSLLARPLATCALYLSALLCGILCARTSDNPLVSALISGAGIVLMLRLISLFSFGITPAAPSPLLSIGMHAGIIAASVLGAVLGTKRPKKRSTSRRRHR